MTTTMVQVEEHLGGLISETLEVAVTVPERSTVKMYLCYGFELFKPLC